MEIVKRIRKFASAFSVSGQRMPHHGLSFTTVWLSYLAITAIGLNDPSASSLFAAGVGLVFTALLAAHQPSHIYATFAIIGGIESIAAALGVAAFQMGVSMTTLGLLFGAGELMMLSSLAVFSTRKSLGLTFEEGQKTLADVNLQSIAIGCCFWFSDLVITLGVGVSFLFLMLIREKYLNKAP